MTRRKTPRRNPKTGRFVSARGNKRRTKSTAAPAGRTRKNPIVGDLVAIEYDPHDGDLRPYRHEAGDVGFGPKRNPAKLYVDPKTGKPSLRGAMRWTSRGLVG